MFAIFAPTDHYTRYFSAALVRPTANHDVADSNAISSFKINHGVLAYAFVCKRHVASDPRDTLSYHRSPAVNVLKCRCWYSLIDLDLKYCMPLLSILSQTIFFKITLFHLG